jgi:putative Mg2+ transporter-C (MgtC) family protein
MVLGGVLGLERELVKESAGLRTHMLIAGSAALIAGLGHLLAADFSDESFRELVRIDPVRVIEAVVAAVGFVAAGTILKRPEGQEVQGLTTAASLLMAAGLGIAAGLGHYLLAVGAAVLSTFVLGILRVVEQRYLARYRRSQPTTSLQPKENA